MPFLKLQVFTETAGDKGVLYSTPYIYICKGTTIVGYDRAAKNSVVGNRWMLTSYEYTSDQYDPNRSK